MTAIARPRASGDRHQPRHDLRHDLRDDRRVLLGTVAVVGLLFAAATSVQSVMALGVFSTSLRAVDSSPVVEIAARTAINLGTVAVVLALTALLAPQRRRLALQLPMLAGIALAAGGARALAQWSSGLYSEAAVPVLLAEVGTTTAASGVTLGIGLALLALWRRLRTEERVRLNSQLEALEAHRELHAEELRVRRDVAEELHGTVQSSLVIVEARLLALAETPGSDAEALASVAEAVRTVRDVELRELMTGLYPADLDRGLVPAVRALIARLPASIVVDDEFAESGMRMEADRPLPLEDRLLVFRLVEEAVTNALRHGGAQRIRIAFAHAGGLLTVTVDDDGRGLPANATPSGLDRLRRQLDGRGGTLTVSPRADRRADGVASGTTLTASLPRSSPARPEPAVTLSAP
ncbi:hypothetical protein N1031_18510 [Herbiconiux moechotypicola]|uniref:histidine kinase n=1 Tax=Herbiconiux moechotypicola TaxID=637393 RepID=A0ABN3DQ82_9MICO|nr:ATP-binding protein [Herbiconiux moechotypicola]MCS5731752.1 hypothetical protein [Herbiconiux moechotypicola]